MDYDRCLPAEKKFGVPENMLSLIQRRWDADPLIRSSFDDIIAELDPMVESRKCRAEKDQRVHEDNASSHTSNTDMPTLLDGVDWSSQGELLSKMASLATNSISWPKFSADGSEYHPKLSWGCFATCGRRESMEDTHFLLPYMCNEENVHAFGIFDGHRGVAAAKFSSRALTGFLLTHCYTCSPAEALMKAFISTDATFREELDTCHKSKGVVKKNWHPSCTALVALIANAGDCRII